MPEDDKLFVTEGHSVALTEQTVISNISEKDNLDLEMSHVIQGVRTIWASKDPRASLSVTQLQSCDKVYHIAVEDEFEPSVLICANGIWAESLDLRFDMFEQTSVKSGDLMFEHSSLNSRD